MAVYSLFTNPHTAVNRVEYIYLCIPSRMRTIVSVRVAEKTLRTHMKSVLYLVILDMISGPGSMFEAFDVLYRMSRV